MKVAGKSMRTIWLEPDGWSVGVIDQTALPHGLVTARLTTLREAAHAIRAMVIRGAPLIGTSSRPGACGVQVWAPDRLTSSVVVAESACSSWLKFRGPLAG